MKRGATRPAITRLLLQLFSAMPQQIRTMRIPNTKINPLYPNTRDISSHGGVGVVFSFTNGRQGLHPVPILIPLCPDYPAGNFALAVLYQRLSLQT
jgi:hypothetical protein